MNPQKPTSIRLALIVCFGLCLVCLGLLVLNSRSRGDLAKLRDETAALRAKLETANRTVEAITAAGGQPQSAKELPPAEGSATADGANPTAATGDSNPGAKPERKRLVDPEEMSALVRSPIMQKIMASQTSTLMQMTYGGLMDRLQLSPEERDYFQRLLVEKQTNLQNLGMQLMNPALSGDDRNGIMKQLTEAWKGGEEKIREFLNDDADYASYQSYSRQEPERKEIGMFEASLAGGDRLDPATADALANLQSDARKKFPFTVDFYDQQNFGNPAVLKTSSVQKFLDEQSQFQAQVAGKAADFLSPAQLQAFKQNQAAVRQMSSMQLNSIVQMAGGGE